MVDQITQFFNFQSSRTDWKNRSRWIDWNQFCEHRGICENYETQGHSCLIGKCWEKHTKSDLWRITFKCNS